MSDSNKLRRMFCKIYIVFTEHTEMIVFDM